MKTKWGPRRSPAKRVRWGEEEQGSELRFRRKAETELNGLCDDEMEEADVDMKRRVTG